MSERSGKHKLSVAAVSAALLLSAVTGSYLYALQPVDLIRKNASSFYVKQGPGQCGPASFYIVFRYYGDDSKDFLFSKGANGSLFRMGKNDLQGDAVSGGGNDSPVVIKKNSTVSKWMNGSDNSTDWGELTAAVNNLFLVNNNNGRERFYSVIESEDRASVPDGGSLQARRKNFYDMIVARFLNRNRPVIVHLKRKWPYPGHYIVLIGFDPATATVYFMDPNDSTGDIVKKVSLDDFTGLYWYEANPELRWGRACWNGQWIGFYRY